MMQWITIKMAIIGKAGHKQDIFRVEFVHNEDKTTGPFQMFETVGFLDSV